MALKGEITPFEINPSKEVLLHLGTVTLGDSVQGLAQGVDLAGLIY